VSVGLARLQFPGSSRLARCALAALFVVFGYDSLPNAAADGDTRTISLHHVHTNEDITITYKRNGRYDPEALRKLDWFLRDWRRNEAVKMDPQLIDLVWEVQRHVGAHKPIWVICGYRAPATNNMLRRRSSGVAQNSMHTIGRALDFYIPDASLESLRVVGLRMQRGGVGYYPTSGSPFVHLDTSSVRHWPRMSREQLARVFPDGRTVHIPSDGQPMGGYALALADIEKRGGSPSQMSLDAARTAGISTVPKAGKNLLAALFGAKDEDEEVQTTASSAARPAVKPVAIKPVAVKRDAIAALVAKSGSAGGPSAVAEQLPAAVAATERLAHATTIRLAAVPMPPARPARPASVVADASSPAGVIAARGTWDIADGLKQMDGLPPVKVAMAGAMSMQGGGDGALAYAVAGADPTPRVTAVSAPGDNTVIKTRRVDPFAQIDDVWLRAAVVTPDMLNFMSATALGPSDPKQLRPLMRKPSSVLAMTFSNDPMGGITNTQFDGAAAIVFLDTVTFVTHTAFLQR